MKAIKIYEQTNHEWIVFGRDPEKPANIIDTNQFMIRGTKRAMLLEPGGIELFSAMLASIVYHTPVENITDLFASHQDPDIISSLGLWDKTLPKARLHAPWLWEGFLRHFGCDTIEYVPIADEGGEVQIDNLTLVFVPAHYVHSSGNFSVYDPKAKILMSGDIGAALLPPEASLFVEDFDEHLPKMKMFHQRWMPSNSAKNDWIERVRALEVEVMAPQHGAIFRGDDVKRFLDWFEALEVGIGVPKQAA